MLFNPHDKPILSDRTMTADRARIEARFVKILPAELIGQTASLNRARIRDTIAKIVSENCWGLWLAGMHHGRDHARQELKLTGHSMAKFALVDDKPPSRIQNKQAEKAIWTRNNTLAGNVADTEWLSIQANLKENVRGDTTRDELQTAIADTLGGQRFRARAETIARTELTFAYNAGRVETYRDNNVESVRRYCIIDERTCEQCAGLNGMVARLDDLGATLRIQPPSHPNCLIAGTLVSTGSVKATTQRHYNGEVIRIETASGNILTVTPNHPILTPQGWIAANLINEGSNVISGASEERVRSVVAPNDYQCNTAIEEIIAAFNEANGTVGTTMKTAPENFHYDGQGSKVHIVNTDRLLGNKRKISIFKQIDEFDFIDAFLRRSAPLNPVSFINQELPSFVSASSGGMSLFDLSRSSFSSHLCPFHFFSSRLTSALGAAIFEESLHRSSLDSKFLSTQIFGQSTQVGSDRVIPDSTMSILESIGRFVRSTLGRSSFSEQISRNQSISQSLYPDMSDTRDLLKSLAGNVKLDRIVKISRSHYEGLVYNIETDTGWYFANDIITHNCRCTISPVIDLKQLAEDNRQPPPLRQDPWLMAAIVAAIIL